MLGVELKKKKLLNPIWKWFLSIPPFTYGCFAFVRDEFLEDKIRDKLRLINMLDIISWYWWVIIGLVIMLIITIVYDPSKAEGNKIQKESKKNKTLRNTLRDIGNGKTDKECALWDYDKYGYSCIPYNDTWKEWISSGNGKYGLVVTVDRPDLDYYNFGEEFYFVDLKTNKKISIPTGDKARKEKVGSSFYDGMVVRLMNKNP